MLGHSKLLLILAKFNIEHIMIWRTAIWQPLKNGGEVMAQIYVPENPRERERLEGGAAPREQKPITRRETRTPKGFSSIDILIVLAFLAMFAFLVTAAARWTAPLTPTVTISLAPSALPLYAGYSLLRMILGYVLSLIFTLVYGHFAATRRRAEIVMVPILDI